MTRSFEGWMTAACTVLIAGCASSVQIGQRPTVHYVGSSTIANFIRDAEPVYGRVRFLVDTEPESVGGEIAIRDGAADLAGVAGHPRPETLSMGVVSTLIGQDAVAVVVNEANPVHDLSSTQLAGIFTGRIRNWKEVGGADLPIDPYIVGPESATRKVFRSAILGAADYHGCEVVRPDAELPMKVEAEPGAIGHISFSFLENCGHVRTLAVDGQQPVPSNSDYPITRPLYLLWWPGRDRVAEFIAWTGTPDAQAVLLKRFAKARNGTRPEASR